MDTFFLFFSLYYKQDYTKTQWRSKKYHIMDRNAKYLRFSNPTVDEDFTLAITHLLLYDNI